MITIFRLNLVAINDIEAQEGSFTGFLARGLVYSMLRQVDPRLADEMHSGKTTPSPFSIKPPHILQSGKLKIFARKVPREAAFSIEVASMDRSLSDALGQAMLSASDELELGKGGKVLVTSIDVRQVKEEELLEAGPIKKFSVNFRTPTYFRISEPSRSWKITRALPLPEPPHMLSNLYRIWNAYMSAKVGEEYLTWLQRQPILIAGARNISTHRYYEHPERGVFTIGFTGRAYYALAEDTYQAKMARVTHQLLRLAEYSNVGGNRTAGYGWITVKVPEI